MALETTRRADSHTWLPRMTFESAPIALLATHRNESPSPTVAQAFLPAAPRFVSALLAGARTSHRLRVLPPDHSAGWFWIRLGFAKTGPSKAAAWYKG